MKSRYRNLLIIFIILIYSTLFLSCNKNNENISQKKQIIYKRNNSEKYITRIDGTIGGHGSIYFDENELTIIYLMPEQIIESNPLEVYSAIYSLNKDEVEIATDTLYKVNVGNEGTLTLVYLVRNLKNNKIYLVGSRVAPYEVTEFNEIHNKHNTYKPELITEYMIGDKIGFPYDDELSWFDDEGNKNSEKIKLKNIAGIMVENNIITLKYEDNTKEVFTIKRIETTSKYTNDIDKSAYEYVFVKIK